MGTVRAKIVKVGHPPAATSQSVTGPLIFRLFPLLCISPAKTRLTQAIGRHKLVPLMFSLHLLQRYSIPRQEYRI
jgi:hypothetical protein